MNPTEFIYLKLNKYNNNNINNHNNYQFNLVATFARKTAYPPNFEQFTTVIPKAQMVN